MIAIPVRDQFEDTMSGKLQVTLNIVDKWHRAVNININHKKAS